MYTKSDHTFVICAYKDNPYLEQTMISVTTQTVQSRVMLSTSTPSDYIENLCKKYDIEYVINPNGKGAGNDWNYGYDHAKTKLVTIVHQDDFYEKDYLKEVLEYANNTDELLIGFTDYYELRNGQKVSDLKLLKIKRVMNYLFKFSYFKKVKWYRKRMLAFGDCISCPTVVLNKEKLGNSIFDTSMKNSCDYITWVNIAFMEGQFFYIPKLLVGHRIYEESATTRNIADNSRRNEDLEIMCKLWPSFIAKIIHKIYIKSEDSNQL